MLAGNIKLGKLCHFSCVHCTQCQGICNSLGRLARCELCEDFLPNKDSQLRQTGDDLTKEYLRKKHNRYTEVYIFKPAYLAKRNPG